MSMATRDMLTRWSREDGERTWPPGAFCIHAEMMRLTFRIVGLTLFSSDVDGDAKDVGQALEVAMHWANDYAESFVRVPPYIPTPANLRFNRAKRTLDDVVFRLISERRESARADRRLRERPPRHADGRDRGGRRGQRHGRPAAPRRDHHDDPRRPRDDREPLSWTFHLLSKHPDVERRVRDEAQRVLGDREPVLEDMKALEYTRMVLEEALRLYPPAWVFERQAVTADVLGGHPIEPGAIVGLCPYVLHRHPDHWENPEGFDPERFRPERAEKRARYAYLPFGGGPRTCVGNHFAMMEAQILLSMIVREHRLELEPSHPVVLDPVITLRPKHGIKVRRRPRAAAPASASGEAAKASSGCQAPRTPSAPRAVPS